jgi:hypothetical protein
MWNWNLNVRTMGEIGNLTPDLTVIYPPKTELAVFYCPSRRGAMGAAGSYSNTERVDPSWTSGGNDYAACSGAGLTFQEVARQTYWLTPAQLQLTVINNPTTGVSFSPFTQFNRNMGMFGVNSSTRIGDVTDGVSNVIMVSERRVFMNAVVNPNNQQANLLQSSDGWAFGGPATMFSGRLAPHSNRHFDEADSMHDGLVQVLLADGSVKKITVNIDLRTWQNLANIAQGSPIDVPLE